MTDLAQPGSLASWLLAQITAEERIANAAALDSEVPEIWQREMLRDSPFVKHIADHDPAHTLAECHAKRRIIELHARTGVRWQNGYPRTSHPVAYCQHDQQPVPCDTLQLLALPYADEPGYDQRWRP